MPAVLEQLRPVSSEVLTKAASITTGTGLLSVAPQMVAAYCRAMRACWPRVVPKFRPTGSTGVGSLRPWRGSFVSRMVRSAPAAVALDSARKASEATYERGDMLEPGR